MRKAKRKATEAEQLIEKFKKFSEEINLTETIESYIGDIEDKKIKEELKRKAINISQYIFIHQELRFEKARERIMSTDNYPKEFDKRFEELLKVEGGYVDDPDDRGGETNFGITKIVAREHGYTGDMKHLPESKAKLIYYEKYWKENNLDRVSYFSAMVAGEMFDTGVNMGTKTAAKFLQRALNNLSDSYNDIAIDGIIGTKTINRIKSVKAKYNGEISIFKMLNILQGMKYIQIVEARPSQKKFLRGWLTRVKA